VAALLVSGKSLKLVFSAVAHYRTSFKAFLKSGRGREKLKKILGVRRGPGWIEAACGGN
jgi:hypothetical protein